MNGREASPVAARVMVSRRIAATIVWTSAQVGRLEVASATMPTSDPYAYPAVITPARPVPVRTWMVRAGLPNTKNSRFWAGQGGPSSSRRAASPRRMPRIREALERVAGGIGQRPVREPGVEAQLHAGDTFRRRGDSKQRRDLTVAALLDHLPFGRDVDAVMVRSQRHAVRGAAGDQGDQARPRRGGESAHHRSLPSKTSFVITQFPSVPHTG